MQVSGQNIGAEGEQNTFQGFDIFFDIFVLLCAILFFMKMVNSAFGRQFYFYYFYFNR